MKNALVIAAREFEEKRFVAYAAVAIAFVPFIFAAIPGLKANPADTIAMGSLVFGSGFAIAVSVISGASFIGRDLSDGRMSFYFSRPVSALSIWFGKLTAAILMIVGTFGFIMLPARIAAGDRWTRLMSTTTTWSVLYILVIAIALFLIAHVISTFVRSRSPLIGIDFAAAVIGGVAILFLIQPLIAGEASVIVSGLLLAPCIAATVGIIGGGAWQLERGRTDRRRNHLALSQFLWGTMAITLLIAAVYVAWVVSVKPGDLTIDMRANRSTSGPFAVITGKSRGRFDYRAGFLLNTDAGSMTRVSPFADGSVHYTRDGRSALIPLADSNMNPANVLIYHKELKEPIDTGLTSPPRDYFVSDDGGRLATISPENVISVYDVAQKRSLISVKLPASASVRAFFVSPDVLRLYLHTREGVKIGEIDARGGGFRETGMVAMETLRWIYPDSSVAHVLVEPESADAVTLNDARTGALITTLASGTHVKAMRFLRDGRIAIVDGSDSATVLHIFTAGGVLEHDVPLGPSRQTILIGDDGVRVVLFANVAPRRNAFIAANLNRGVIERRETVPFWVPSGFLDPRPTIEPLRDVSYGDERGHIMSWNPATGAKRTITGG
jgi:ABC-type transport system involved in multi-copper enzyme maturation permease subunit